MDVGKPSNFERVLELFDQEYEEVRDVVQAYRVDDEQTVATIQSVYKRYDYLLDPHTAVGWRVAAEHGDAALTKVLIATASPVKFAHELRTRAGIEVDDSAEIAALQRRPSRKITIPNTYQALSALLSSARN
jgi:threonine synthase